MLQGNFSEKCAVIWGGLKHADKKLTPHQVPAMLQAHIDTGGEWDRDVWIPCLRAALEDKMLGSFNEREVERIMSELGEGQTEEGKG